MLPHLRAASALVRSILGIAILCTCAHWSMSQRDSTAQAPAFSLGMSFGMNLARLGTYPWITSPAMGGYRFQNLPAAMGLDLGLVMQVAVTPRFHLRFLPMVSLNELRGRILPQTPGMPPLGNPNRAISWSMLYLPACLQWKLRGTGRFQPWIQGGPMPAFNIGKRQPMGLSGKQIDKFDFGLCIGIGANIVGERFELAPEIRLRASLVQTIRFTQNGFPLPMPDLFSQILGLVVTFE